MTKKTPNQYVILVLTERDLQYKDLISEQIDSTHFRWTPQDLHHADRVDFISSSGESRTIKQRLLSEDKEVKLIGRPASFEFFGITMPWVAKGTPY